MISDMIRQQASGYCICLCTGIVFGIAGAAVNYIVKLLKKHCIIRWVCDISFWLALSVAVVVVNYICNNGDIRLYIFLGFFSGFLVSFYTIDWVARKIMNYILYQKEKD